MPIESGFAGYRNFSRSATLHSIECCRQSFFITRCASSTLSDLGKESAYR